MSNHNSESSTKETNVSLWQIIVSGLAAIFGVQSEKNRKRDFEKGKPADFIFIGVALLIVFFLTVYTIVRIVLSSSGVE